MSRRSPLRRKLSRFRKKAAVEIFSLVIVLVVSMALVGTTYMWGMPLIIKRQDKVKIDRVYNYFNEDNANSLVYKIQEVANSGGKETFTADISGLWILHNYTENSVDNNSIEFVTQAKFRARSYLTGLRLNGRHSRQVPVARLKKV